MFRLGARSRCGPNFCEERFQLFHLLGILRDEIFRLSDIVRQIVQLGGDLSGLLSILVGALLASGVTGRPVFPRPLPHGQPSRRASRMIDEVIAHRLFGRANRRGEHVEAVRPRVIGQWFDLWPQRKWPSYRHGRSIDRILSRL